MQLSDALRSLLPGTGAVIAIVGGGGKTSALFTLAEELALGGPGDHVLVTTTTHIVDPRTEQGRPFDQLLLDPDLAGPAHGKEGPPVAQPQASTGRGRRLVLAAGSEGGRLQGLHPSWLEGLRRDWPFLLVEADGSRRRPIKAPADHEPVLPPTADLVLGLVGLDCLGQPMDEGVVHRPERFGPLTGAAPGSPIRLDHIGALCRAPQGLFKDAPPAARRVLVLNKADLCAQSPWDLLRALRALPDLGLHRILVCSLGNSDPARRVLAQD